MVDDVTHTSKAGVPRDGHLSHLQPRRYAGGYVQPHRTTRSVVQLQLQSYRVCRLELELDTVLARRRRTSENVRERNARSPSQAPSLDGGFFDISTRTDWRTHARTHARRNTTAGPVCNTQVLSPNKCGVGCKCLQRYAPWIR